MRRRGPRKRKATKRRATRWGKWLTGAEAVEARPC